MSVETGTRCRTILRMQARAGCEQAFEDAWRIAAEEISRVPGNLHQELVRDATDPRTFLIVSDWADEMRSGSSSRELAMTEGPNESSAIESSRATAGRSGRSTPSTGRTAKSRRTTGRAEPQGTVM